MLTCAGFLDLLLEYVSNELPAGTRGQVQDHLAACPRCSGELDRYLGVIALARSLPVQAPANQFTQPRIEGLGAHDQAMAHRIGLAEDDADNPCVSLPEFPGEVGVIQLLVTRQATGIGQIEFLRQSPVRLARPGSVIA